MPAKGKQLGKREVYTLYGQFPLPTGPVAAACAADTGASESIAPRSQSMALWTKLSKVSMRMRNWYMLPRSCGFERVGERESERASKRGGDGGGGGGGREVGGERARARARKRERGGGERGRDGARARARAREVSLTI